MLVSEQLRTYPSPNLTLPLTKLLSLLVSFCFYAFYLFVCLSLFFFLFLLFVCLFIYLFFNIVAGLGEG